MLSRKESTIKIAVVSSCVGRKAVSGMESSEAASGAGKKPVMAATCLTKRSKYDDWAAYAASTVLDNLTSPTVNGQTGKDCFLLSALLALMSHEANPFGIDDALRKKILTDIQCASKAGPPLDQGEAPLNPRATNAFANQLRVCGLTVRKLRLQPQGMAAADKKLPIKGNAQAEKDSHPEKKRKLVQGPSGTIGSAGKKLTNNAKLVVVGYYIKETMVFRKVRDSSCSREELQKLFGKINRSLPVKDRTSQAMATLVSDVQTAVMNGLDGVDGKAGCSTRVGATIKASVAQQVTDTLRIIVGGNGGGQRTAVHPAAFVLISGSPNRHHNGGGLHYKKCGSSEAKLDAPKQGANEAACADLLTNAFQAAASVLVGANDQDASCGRVDFNREPGCTARALELIMRAVLVCEAEEDSLEDLLASGTEDQQYKQLLNLTWDPIAGCKDSDGSAGSKKLTIEDKAQTRQTSPPPPIRLNNKRSKQNCGRPFEGTEQQKSRSLDQVAVWSDLPGNYEPDQLNDVSLIATAIRDTCKAVTRPLAGQERLVGAGLVLYIAATYHAAGSPFNKSTKSGWAFGIATDDKRCLRRGRTITKEGLVDVLKEIAMDTDVVPKGGRAMRVFFSCCKAELLHNQLSAVDPNGDLPIDMCSFMGQHPGGSRAMRAVMLMIQERFDVKAVADGYKYLLEQESVPDAHGYLCSLSGGTRATTDQS